MPNAAELLQDHVTLTVDCVDRLYLNAYVPRLQSSGGVVGFLAQRGHDIPSPALWRRITDGFKTALHTWCQEQAIPWLEFPAGARKDDVVEPYRQRFLAGGATDGVVLVGVAQERNRGWRATKRVQGREVHFDYVRTTVYVNHYYVYVLDREWGPAFVKICGYCPYTMKRWLNGHEWAKRQLTTRGSAFQALDNGFLTCEDPATLQTICASLGASDMRPSWPAGPPDCRCP